VALCGRILPGHGIKRKDRKALLSCNGDGSMGVGRGGGQAPTEFEIFLLNNKQRKDVFLVSSGKNEILPLLTPLLEKSTIPPSGKNPSDAHGRKSFVVSYQGDLIF